MAKKTNDAESVHAAGIESEYTVEEFAASSYALFGTGPDLVVAAFRMEGIESATKKRAVSIVNAFKNKPITH